MPIATVHFFTDYDYFFKYIPDQRLTPQHSCLAIRFEGREQRILRHRKERRTAEGCGSTGAAQATIEP